jgi:hypothetical protein
MQFLPLLAIPIIIAWYVRATRQPLTLRVELFGTDSPATRGRRGIPFGTAQAAVDYGMAHALYWQDVEVVVGRSLPPSTLSINWANVRRNLTIRQGDR